MSQELPDRLERQAYAVAERALQEYAVASPRYQGTVPDHLRGHMPHTNREAVRLFARLLREDREPTDAELRLYRDRGWERGAEGLPVTDFVDAYFVLAEVLWAEVVRLGGGTEAATALLRFAHRTARAAVEAHQEAYTAAHSDERDAMHTTVRALVANEPIAEFAARFDIAVAEAYGVLAVRFAAHPSESVGDAVGRRLAGRRKVALLVRHLRRELGTDVLHLLDPAGGTVLLPSRPDGAAADLARARAAAPRVHQQSGTALTCGFAHAPTLADLPAAAAQAARLVALAQSPGQVADLDEHLFAVHQRHDSDAAPRLRAIAEALHADPELLTTVRRYFANDFSRRRTAQELHVHPNTIDNRLGRIAALTGANPRTAPGLLTLAAALHLPG